MWRYKVCGADTIVCNAPCKIKKIILYHTAATTAVVYDEADGTHTAGKKVWTLATNQTTTVILRDEIDFGDEGVSFNYGCAIDWNAGVVLVVYKF